jgi:TPR repeat protein
MNISGVMLPNKEFVLKRCLIATSLCFSLCMGVVMPAAADYNSGEKAYRHGDYAAALREFTTDDSARAKFYLSLMYDKGDGVVQDREKSVEWLRKAAEQGLEEAQTVIMLATAGN